MIISIIVIKLKPERIVLTVKLMVLSDKAIGATLASSIYNSNGMLFMNRGILITDKTLFHLKKIGISTIYIEDGNSEVNLQEVLEPSIKIQIIKSLKAEFVSISKNKKINDDVFSNCVKLIIENINLSENALLYDNIGHEDELMKLVTHSLNVTILSVMVGIKRKYDMKKINSLGMGSLLHDVGKLISTGEDHAEQGYKLAKLNSMFTPTINVTILQHHENVNGTGFPQKINGEKIYEFAKIVAVCNSYINNLSLGILPHEALEKITAQANIIYDAETIKDFSSTVYCYPSGLTVQLNNGMSGTIISQNQNFPLRPIVEVVVSEGKKYINLLKELTVFIDKVII